MVLRELWALVRNLRQLPDLIADWCDRKVMSMHWPEIVPADDLSQWPSGEMPWCLRDDVPWPCDEFAEASDRLAGRQS